MSRRVLVTAGAAGIGRVIAEQFIQDGSRVAVCDADPAAVQSFADAYPGSIAVVADVTSEQEAIDLATAFMQLYRENAKYLDRPYK